MDTPTIPDDLIDLVLDTLEHAIILDIPVDSVPLRLNESSL